MRPLTSILALVASALAACAANVSQTSADRYYFTRPNLPSNIIGRVMGSPADYNVPRSEDIAWLYEAYMEREALLMGSWTGRTEHVELRPEYGSWPLSESNRFERWTAVLRRESGNVSTNIIVGWNYVTNWGKGIDTADIRHVTPMIDCHASLMANTNHYSGGYLSTNDALYATTARLMGTNIIESVTRSELWVPAWTPTNSYITMEMTNGTQSVHTNAWRMFTPTSMVVVVTNQYYPGDNLVAYMFETNVVAGHDMPAPRPLSGLLDSAALTNHFDFLRGTYRLAKGVESDTNKTIRAKTIYSSDGNPDHTTTNSNVVWPRVRRIASYARNNGYTINENDSCDPVDWQFTPNTTSYGSQTAFEAYSGSQRYYVTGLFRAAFPDGALRIKRAVAWAGVACQYYESSSADGKDVHNHYTTDLVCTCAVPLGDAEAYIHSRPIGSNQVDQVAVTLSFGSSWVAAAWSCCTNFPLATFPSSSSWRPQLRYTAPSASHKIYDNLVWDDFCGGWVHDYDAWPGTSSTSVDLLVDLRYIYLLIDFEPLTSLPGW